jgi:antitoxin component of MazEF toxin-antitoxin module
VVCQDAGDGSGDLIVELPPELLEMIELDIGDELSLEELEGTIVMKPLRRVSK